MIRPPAAPRLQPTDLEALDDDLRTRIEAAISTTTGGANLYLTLARYPGLTRRFLSFGGKLLAAGRLPIRAREIAILRTAWLCRCDYEWGQHERIAQDCDMSLDEIRALATESPGSGLNASEHCLVAACDELMSDHRVGPDTWDALLRHYGEIGTIEVIMLIGNYAMLAGFLNSANVAREPGVPGFPDV